MKPSSNPLLTDPPTHTNSDAPYGDRLDALILNAGLAGFHSRRTAQGYDLVLGVNFLGHYALARALLPLLERTARRYYKPEESVQPRVVCLRWVKGVGLGTGGLSEMRLHDLDHTHSPPHTYTHTHTHKNTAPPSTSGRGRTRPSSSRRRSGARGGRRRRSTRPGMPTCWRACTSGIPTPTPRCVVGLCGC